MRPRFLAASAAFIVGGLCFAGFAASAKPQDASPPPKTSGVEVAGKVIEFGPEKDPIDEIDLARTGADLVVPLAMVGIGVLAVGLALVDFASLPAKPIRRPPPRRQSLPR